MQMDRTDTEKRRRALLAQTRSLYSEKSFSPAVHPRYRNAYNSLYGDGEDMESSGLFGLRVILCCLLFIGFVMMDNYDITVADVSSRLPWITKAFDPLSSDGYSTPTSSSLCRICTLTTGAV